MVASNFGRGGFRQTHVHSTTTTFENELAGHCHQLHAFPAFSRNLRFAFGQEFYVALVWFLEQLKFPDVDISSTKGVTFVELAMDFELSTGIILPGSASRRTDHDGNRWRRSAACPVQFVQDLSSSQNNNLQHQIEQIDEAGRKKFFLQNLSP